MNLGAKINRKCEGERFKKVKHHAKNDTARNYKCISNSFSIKFSVGIVFFVLRYVLQEIFLVNSETKQKFRKCVEEFPEN